MEKHPIYPIGSLAEYPSCHASNLIELPTGELLATWWAGSFEKSPDVSIWTSRLDLNGNKGWSVPKIAHNTPNHFDGTPVLYLSPENTLFLFYRKMHHGKIIPAGHSVTQILYKTSQDYGKTWSKSKFLRKGWFRVIRCEPLRTPQGWVILPFHRELFTYQSRFYINKDPELQDAWKTHGRLKVPGGCLEPSVCMTSSGSILCGLRTYKANFVYFSRSMDGGKTWTKPFASKVPNPNSQVDLLSLKNGNILMACNPAEKIQGKNRGELSVFRSLDEGKTWDMENKLIIEKEIGKEFSYPCMIQTDDGCVHLSYTYKRKTINHVIFREEEELPTG